MRMIRRKVKLIPICDRESNNRSLCVIILYHEKHVGSPIYVYVIFVSSVVGSLVYKYLFSIGTIFHLDRVVSNSGN
jgi:hypothetical protein